MFGSNQKIHLSYEQYLDVQAALRLAWLAAEVAESAQAGRAPADRNGFPEATPTQLKSALMHAQTLLLRQDIEASIKVAKRQHWAHLVHGFDFSGALDHDAREHAARYVAPGQEDQPS